MSAEEISEISTQYAVTFCFEKKFYHQDKKYPTRKFIKL